MAPRRKFNAFVSELSDVDEDYNPGECSSDSALESADEEVQAKDTKKKGKEMDPEELEASDDDEEEEEELEHEPAVVSDDEVDDLEAIEALVSNRRPSKRPKTSDNRGLEPENPFGQPAPRKKRGAGKKKRRNEEESSCNKEWLRWVEEFESLSYDDPWSDYNNKKSEDEEYEKNRKLQASCMEKYATPDEFIYPLLPFQSEFLAWGMKQELSVYKGGILADEMGMGKTIQALSLILGGRTAAHGHEEESVLEAEKLQPEPEFDLEKINATLVVCPVVAIEQWRSEIERFTSEGSLKVLIYHGSSRKNIGLEDLSGYDVVLSTYSTIEHDYRKNLTGKVRCKYCKKPFTDQGYKRHLKFFCGPLAVKSALKKKGDKKGESSSKKKKGGVKRKRDGTASRKTLDRACNDAEKIVFEGSSLLHSVKWIRVILDEAHTIKERASNTAKAVFALETCYRWLLSGTPLQNRVGELCSLVRFLRLDPFAYFFCTKCDCKILDYQMTCDKCDHTNSHLSWWNKFVSNPIKNGGYRADGERSMKLLKRKILDQVLLRRTKIERAADLVIPPKTVIIRKDCLDEHEDDFYEALYKQSKSEFNTFVKQGTVVQNYANIFDLLTRLRQAVDHPYLITASLTLNKKTQLCGLCNDILLEPETGKCGDSFCKACLAESEKMNKACPRCSKPVIASGKPGTASTYPEVHKKVEGFRKASIIHRLELEKFRTSTKIEALKEEIRRMVANDPSAKALVFSQFTSMLDLIRYSFYLAGIKCVYMDGAMALGQRVSMIETFRNDPECKVFLMSLKAGGVALNLTVASQIFLMDPWWNPAVEHQAQDRIHRIGQCKPIRVTRFIIEKSIEERILELQSKKQLVFEGTIGGSSEALSKLTEKDFKFLFSS